MEDAMRRFFLYLQASLEPVFIFLLCQVIGGGVTYFGVGLTVSMLVSSVATVVWLLLRHKFVKQDFRTDVTWHHSGIFGAVVGAMAVILSMNVFSEWLDLPDYIIDTIVEIAGTPLGILCIALLGPLSEELCFRAAIIGGMVRIGGNRMTAVLVSSLLFGLVHLNPAQIPFATVMGVALGLLYVRTESVLLPLLVHVLNNSIAVLQIAIMGEAVKDFRLEDVMDMKYLLVIAMLYMLAGAYLLWRFARQSKSQVREEMRHRLRVYSTESLSRMSQTLQNTVADSNEWQQSHTVLLYHALPTEVGTALLLDDALRTGKVVLLPRVEGERLTLHPYVPGQMAVGAYGIMEPTSELFTESRYGEIDLVLVPGVAFDRRGHRLGHGKGYYDRLLPLLPTARKMGLCFPFQVIAAVPCSSHDVKMDSVCGSV